MQISSRFAVAVHSLLVIAAFSDDQKVTSDFIASSTNINPAAIRRTLIQLKRQGLITVKAGCGGALLCRPPEDVTLLDVFRAVEPVDGNLFRLHENPNPLCPVGRNIHPILTAVAYDAQTALEVELGKHTLASLLAQIDN